MRLLHLADLHLGWRPEGWPEERAEQRRHRRDAVLAGAVDAALAEGVELVLIVGDLFDHFDPPTDLVDATLEQLRRLEHAGIVPVTVPGNHDELTYGTSVYRRRRAEWPGVLVAEPAPAHLASLELGGVSVHLYGMAYTGGVTGADLPLRDFPRLERSGVHIAAYHGVLGVAAPGARTLSLDEEALAAARYHYVALGHLHDPIRHRFPAGPAVYPGAPEALDFGDGGCGTLTVAEWDGEAMAVRELPLAVQRVSDVALDLTPVDDIGEIDQAVAALADPDAVQRVRLEGALWLPELDVRALEERHAHAFFHLEILDDLTGLAPELIARWAEEASVRGAFVARMLERLQGSGTASRERLERALRWGVAALAGTGAPSERVRPPEGPP